MTPQEERLLRIVHFRIDEAYGLGTQPSLEPEQVLFELNAAARQVVRAAPRSIVSVLATNASATANSWVSNNSGQAYANPGVIAQIPSADVLRVLRVQLSDWVKPVDTLINVDQTLYKQQFNKFQRATIYNPVAAIVPRMVGPTPAIAIECFPRPTSPTNPFSKLIVLPNLSAGVLTTLHPDLEDAVTYVTAARIIKSERGDPAKAAEYEASGIASIAQAAPDYPGAPIVE